MNKLKTEEGLRFNEATMETENSDGEAFGFVDCGEQPEEVLEEVAKELARFGLEIVLGIPDEPNDQTYFRIKIANLETLRNSTNGMVQCRHCNHVFGDWIQHVGKATTLPYLRRDDIHPDALYCPKCSKFLNYVE